MTTFQPLQQRTTPDGVYRVLRAAILDGSVAPGGQLREAHIAADLGISRAPLREALTRLEEDGLVIKVPFRGAFVAEVGAETIAEIASVRYLVEPYAAELSAAALRGPAKKELTAAVKGLHQATRKGDIPASIDAHLQFHRLFYVHSAHGILQDLWNGWESKLRLFLAVDHRSYNDLDEVARAHARLAGMVLDGDLAGQMDAFRHELAHHLHSAPGAAIEDQVMAPSEARKQDRSVG